MGLDMYLTKHTYVRKYGDDKPTLTLEYPGVQANRVQYIHEEIGYWRKANAIHQWFVHNVQNGVDECQESYVDEEQLKALLDVVMKVQENHGLASELLPTQSGFFFGNMDYDQYYFDALEDTRKILEAVLAEDETGELFYHSSW